MRAIGSLLLALAVVACATADPVLPTTTTIAATLPSTATLTGVLDCPEAVMVMEPSNMGSPSAQVAAESTLSEATMWDDIVFEEIESNQWSGTVDARRVIRFSTFRNEDGAWDWVELTYCER